MNLINGGIEYQAFVRNFLSSSYYSFSLAGISNVDANYLFGPLNVNNLPLTAQVQLKGLDKLNSTKVNSISMQTCDLFLTVVASIYNPSIVTLSLNSLPLIMSYKGVDLGLVSANNFQMIPANNLLV